VPLLKRMANGRAPDEKVVPCFGSMAKGKDLTARQLRAHLQRANVKRPELFDMKSRTHHAIGFRSWRDTGITWEAIRGTDALRLQRRAGHETTQTTLGYVKEAEDRSSLVGTVFPNLAPLDQNWTREDTEAGKNKVITVEAPGIECELSDVMRESADDSRMSDPMTTDANDASSTRNVAKSREPDRHLGMLGRSIDRVQVTRLAAKARIVESLSSGDVRVIATELRESLEALCDADATVISLSRGR
jgi:hypothetical protein